MKGSHCRLYDENLVRNIMITTSASIMEFVKNNKLANTEDVCEFVEFNSDDIIAETIKNLNKDETGSKPQKGYDEFDDDLPPADDEDENDTIW